MNTAALASVYLGAIVGANLSTTAFGPSVSIINAFLFIGLDLSTRDRLHDAWGSSRRGLLWRMAALIATGGLISYALNADAARIALASCVAFAVAAAIDGIIYYALRRRPAWQRVNGSNIPAAAADSLLFPTIAFGVFMPWIIVGQLAAKVGGGALWGWLLYRNRGVNGCSTSPTPQAPEYATR